MPQKENEAQDNEKDKKPKKKMKLWKKILIAVLIVVLIIGIAGFFVIRRFFYQPPIKSATGSDQAVVETVNGKIQGSLDGDIYQYLGVPYAQAKERFVPAEDVPKWDGIFEATSTGAMSPQSGMLGMSSGS